MKRYPVKIRACKRKAAIAVVVAFMLFVLVVMAALTVDVAYMHLVRSDLRIATDAATKAAAEALARTEDEQAAIEAAQDIASMHDVAGRPFSLSADDIDFGRVETTESGQTEFVAGAEPPNSVRIQTGVGDGYQTEAFPLLFAPALGHESFETAQAATATRQNVEVVLALDRSGSMGWDMSGYGWAYPDGNPNLSSFYYWGTTWQYYLSPPHPTDSRWGVMDSAVNIFIEEAGQFIPPPRISLVTWSNEYSVNADQYRYYSTASLDVALPSRNTDDWAANSQAVLAALDARGQEPVMGGTNMAAGIDLAAQQLVNSDSRLAKKIVIVLTDGQWNAGRDPVDAARDAADQELTIHTVSMNGGSEYTCREVARITGGSYHSASNPEQLREAFRDLARSLPITLVE